MKNADSEFYLRFFIFSSSCTVSFLPEQLKVLLSKHHNIELIAMAAQELSRSINKITKSERSQAKEIPSK